MPELFSAPGISPCRECGGTGRNGRIGPYPLLCRPCLGSGHLIKDFAHVVEDGEGGDEEEEQ